MHSSSPEKYQFIHHFVPHPYHKTRATLLSIPLMWFYTLTVFAFLVVFKTTPHLLPGVLGYASNINTDVLLKETNKIRMEHGLSPLTVNNKLAKAAEKKANHMFEKDYWAHISPDGVKPWDFILQSDYDYAFAGENLAKNFDTSDQVVKAWYESASHRENLLSTNYDEIGFAVLNGVLDGYETTLVVQMFGRPRTEIAVATIDPAPTPEVLPDLPINPAKELAIDVPQLGSLDVAKETFIPDPTYTNSVVINMADVSKILLSLFISFVLLLLALDIWYSKRRGILKFTGHTLAHMLFLVTVLAGVWMVISPGKVL